MLQLCDPYRFHQIHGLLQNTITNNIVFIITYVKGLRRCGIKILERDQRRGHALTDT